MLRFTSSCETGVNVSELTAEGSGTIFTESEADCDCELIPVLMSSILSMKKSLKSWANFFEDLLVGRIASLVPPSRFLVILNKFF